MTLPKIPTIYYVHCPICDKVSDVFLESFFKLDENRIAFQCQCGIGQAFKKDCVPTDERSAYKHTIANLIMVNNDQNDRHEKVYNNLSNRLYASELASNKLKAKESLMSTNIFATEKGVREILEELEREDVAEAVKFAKYEATDLLQYIVKEQDKAKINEKEIEKKTHDEWRHTMQENFTKPVTSS